MQAVDDVSPQSLVSDEVGAAQDRSDFSHVEYAHKKDIQTQDETRREHTYPRRLNAAALF
jgi:hypothetical protein